MMQSKAIRPINSLIAVEDAGGGEPPEWVDGQLILSSPSLIFIGCYPEPDGPTQLILGPARKIEPAGEPAFDDLLETPSRIVMVATVTGESLLSENVTTELTRVRIWPNHGTWPDKIIIGLG